ncbi:MAG: helix-hairpin-helix domain-containing protein [Elusimicrobia bacterium]|nr:helix-hairpin-helix domain-containing protein [Elusimicrobiota bacterium]
MTQMERNCFLFLVFFLALGLGIRIYRSGKKNGVPDQNRTAMNSSRPLRVDLNKASLQDLERLPGIGPKLAQTILTFREKSGSFSKLDEIQKVKGIGKERYSELKKYLFITQEKEPGPGKR